jgi:hypothetical protein
LLVYDDCVVFEAFATAWFIRRKLGETDPDSATSNRSIQGVDREALALEVARSIKNAKLTLDDKRIVVDEQALAASYATAGDLFAATDKLRKLCTANGELLKEEDKPFSDFLSLRWAMGALFEVFPSSRPSDRPVSDNAAFKGIGAMWIARKGRDAGLEVDPEKLLKASAKWTTLYEAGESVLGCVK